jgi:hypothetical protein
MRIPVLLSALLLSGSALLAQREGTTPTHDLLARYMLGSFSSAEQARNDTDYFDIELEMARIWRPRTDGIWVYVEQARADAKYKASACISWLKWTTAPSPAPCTAWIVPNGMSVATR